MPDTHGLTLDAELIDKCVGSRIWVVMKGDKGAPTLLVSHPSHLTRPRPTLNITALRAGTR
jgi:hypothetical protein